MVAAEQDALLDQFMPRYDVVERHSIRIDAPAEVTFAAACEMDLLQSPVIRAIFKLRQWILGARPEAARWPCGIIASTKAMGWSNLAETPGREIVMGAITQPWFAEVVFRPVAPEQFERCSEPDHVKIAWTLRADPLDKHTSVFRTETRVFACDPEASAKFRRYWRKFSIGIKLIRLLSLQPLKREAERRAGTLRAP